MTKRDLVLAVHDRHPDTAKKVIKTVVEHLFSELMGALERGEKITLANFGVFHVSTIPAGIKRNPLTWEESPRPAYRRVLFRSSPAFKRFLNRP